MSPTIYITLQTGLIFIENRIFQPRYKGTTEKPRFLSENDDIRGASHYAYLKNSTFIFSAIVKQTKNNADYIRLMTMQLEIRM